MAQKDSDSKKKAAAKGSQFTLEFTRKKLLFWLAIAFLAMVWMFTLGVLVGRDLSPVRFDVKKLKKELIALKQKTLQTDQAQSKVETDDVPREPDFGFYKVLTDKKEEARFKFAKSHEQTTKLEPTSPEAAKANSTDKNGLRLKLTEVHKPTLNLQATVPEAPKPKKMEKEGLMTIQVASLTSAEEAREMVTRLKRKGYEAYEVAVTLPGKGTYHRVRVGHFTDSDEASRVAARLKRERFEVMIFQE